MSITFTSGGLASASWDLLDDAARYYKWLDRVNIAYSSSFRI